MVGIPSVFSASAIMDNMLAVTGFPGLARQMRAAVLFPQWVSAVEFTGIMSRYAYDGGGYLTGDVYMPLRVINVL
jgi:hypothetical protein